MDAIVRAEDLKGEVSGRWEEGGERSTEDGNMELKHGDESKGKERTLTSMSRKPPRET